MLIKRQKKSPICTSLVLVLGLMTPSLAHGQAPLQLVKDINPGVEEDVTSDVSYLTNVNGTLFFRACGSSLDPAGCALWKTDGTDAGTVRVKGIDPSSLTAVRDTLFFVGYDGATGSRLWKSDGTEDGTVLVKDVNVTSRSYALANVDGTLFFAGSDGVTGAELWKSDGTGAGTVPVKDVDPSGLTAIDGTLFFAGDDGRTGRELWKSDGTEAGTVLVKDINPGAPSSAPRELTAVNGTLFFAADDGTHGLELWKSDGTEAGTVLVKDIIPGKASFDFVNSSNPADLTAANGTLFFQACDGGTVDLRKPTNCELWKSDGTEAGTVLVKDINPNPWVSSSSVNELTIVGDMLFFQACDAVTNNGTPTDCELWKSNGTEAGTVLVKDINPSADSSYPVELTDRNGVLFFAANDGTTGQGLWKSDGTTVGTVLLKSSTGTSQIANVDGTLFFVSCTRSGGCQQLWKSDGTQTGTVLVKDIGPPRDSNPAGLTNVNGTLFFAADDGTHGVELWKSDGTEAGTQLVKDIDASNPLYQAGIRGSTPSYLTNVNGTAFFQACDGMLGDQYHTPADCELWKSDGTEAGTVMVKDIYPGGRESNPSELINVNGTLFFQACDAVDGYGRYTDCELWKSDGTEGGTVLVKDINPGADSSSPHGLAAIDDTVFFAADDGTSGIELWRSDGTEAGTVLVKDVIPGPYSSNPENLTAVNGTLFFRNWDGENGYGSLWKSDGMEAGTVLVKDFPAGTRSSNLCELTDVDGTLFFQACYLQVTGLLMQINCELWKSDGTLTGTELVRDSSPPSVFGTLQFETKSELTSINGGVFFTNCAYASGCELWRSDGTAAGTELVKDINPGAGSSNPHALKNVNGMLFFAADDGTTGTEPWKSDGTPGGTVRVADLWPGADSSDPSDLTQLGDDLLFVAASPETGRELWRLPNATATLVPCVGDCDRDDQVTVDELLTGVNIALGNAQLDTCSAFDANHDGSITVDEILTAVNNALNGCPPR